MRSLDCILTEMAYTHCVYVCVTVLIFKWFNNIHILQINAVDSVPKTKKKKNSFQIIFENFYLVTIERSKENDSNLVE